MMRVAAMVKGQRRLYSQSSYEKIMKLVSTVKKHATGMAGKLILFGTGASFTAAVGTYPNLKEMFKDAAKISDYMAPKIKENIADTEAFDELKKDKMFAERPSLSSQITDILNRKKAAKVYDVVYGAHGVGKSTIVDSAIQGRRGVLKIKITSVSTVAGIMNELAKITGTTKFDPQINDFMKAMRIGGGNDGTVPTIVFEIERGKSNEQQGAIQDVRSFAKEMSAVCNIILILSEANAVLDFGKDNDREAFIYVDELSELEARECLAGLKLKLSEAEIKYLIDNIGANPAAFNKMQIFMTLKGISVENFVALKLSEATADLDAFPHKAILKALKDHPEGVSPGYFNNMENKGVDLSNPRAVAVSMKESNALTYRIELKKYMMLSRCHEVALRSYKLEKLNSRWWSRFFF